MLFDPKRLLLIAGPCSLENETVCRTVATELADIRAWHPELNIVFKGSFDKANRTSPSGARGTGLEAGLDLPDHLLALACSAALFGCQRG